MYELTPAQQSHNRTLMLAYAKAGVPVFVSSGKTPLVAAYNKLDKDITEDQREQIVAEYAAKHDGREPQFIGATTDVATVKKMYRAYPHAVPSIACGPAGLIALDADKKNNGPEQLDEFFAANGGKPQAAIQSPTKSEGYHLYFKNEGKLGNRAGALKRLGADVRGTGGQCVAPGTWLPSGRYGTMDNAAEFMKAFVNNTFPSLPDFVTDAIGKTPDDAKPEEASDNEVRTTINALIQAEWPTFEDIFDGELGKYDLATLSEKDSEFAALYEKPGSDCSDNRFKIARALLREYRAMPVEDLAVFFDHYGGSGEFIDDGRPGEGQYDFRQIAREWLKNQGLRKVTDGSAFGAVDEGGAIDDEPYRAKTKETPGLDVTFADEILVDYKHMRWRVKHLLPHVGVGVMYGLANAGKSFIALDGSIKTRNGEQWFGRKTVPANVIYCYGEGVEGIGGRIKAAYDYRGDNRPKKHIGILKVIPNFFSDRGAVKKMVKAARAVEASTDEAVGMIVIDTLAVAAAGADENAVEHMTVVFDRLREVARLLDCCVLVVHHADKKGATMRGSSAVNGTADFVLRVEEGKNGAYGSVFAEKMRDAPKGFSVKFKLKQVDIGTDLDGDAVTSCVIVDLTEPGRDIDISVDEADEPAEDALTPEQNEASYDKMVARSMRLADVIAKHGRRSGDAYLMTMADAAIKFPELLRFKKATGSNFKRQFTEKWLADDVQLVWPTGRLWLVSKRGAQGTTLWYRPESLKPE